MALAAPAKVSLSPAWILRQDADGTRGQKTAEGDGGRSAPVPEPRAVWLPGYRVQLGADLPILCRAAGSLVAAFSALGADPAEVEKGGREGLPEGAAKAQPRHSQGTAKATRPRHGLAGYSERSSISLGMFPPDRGQISSPPPSDPQGKPARQKSARSWVLFGAVTGRISCTAPHLIQHHVLFLARGAPKAETATRMLLGRRFTQDTRDPLMRTLWN